MIAQPHLFPEDAREAGRAAWGVFSDCTDGTDCKDPYCQGRPYRYLLAVPTGVDNERIALGVFANPSTATPAELDPTLTRWRNYCRDWGFGWSWTVNVRAWRETNPELVPPDPLAIGPANDRHIVQAALGAELVVCGWGLLGGERGPVALDLIRRAGKVPHALKLTKDGSPEHPRYLRADLKPFPMHSEITMGQKGTKT